MLRRKDPSKALQIGFLVLLIVSVAQVAWWMAENISHARDVQARISALYTAQAEALAELREQSPPEFAVLLPYLEFGTDPPRVDADALAALEREADSRINRYLWEGGFFLLVLLGGITVLTRAIRHDAELRRRQQNFLAAVSHEFKSPLASMRLGAETLELRAQDAETRRIATRLLAEGDRLLRMVDNLLEATLADEVSEPLSRQPVALAPLVQATSDELLDRAGEHGVGVDLDVPEGLTVAADPEALTTVLRNLLDNALKACVAGDGEVIAVSASAVDRAVEIRVRDDGVGFAPEYAGLIFDKFYRLGDEDRRDTSGTGLGLYIVRRLAERSGAVVRGHSDGPGTGATFTLVWPAGDAA